MVTNTVSGTLEGRAPSRPAKKTPKEKTVDRGPASAPQARFPTCDRGRAVAYCRCAMKRALLIALAAAGIAALLALANLRRAAPPPRTAPRTAALPRPAAGLPARALAADYRYRPPAIETQSVDTFWTRPPTPPPPVENPDVIPGEFVLTFFDARDQAEFVRLLRARGGEVLAEMDFLHAIRIRVRDRAAFEALLRDGPTPTRHAENYAVREPQPWGRNPLAPESGYRPFGDQSLVWLGIDPASPGRGRGVTLAVLDSGVDDRHPVLQNAEIETLAAPGVAVSGAGGGVHGSAVAGLLVGQGAGVAGAAPASRLLSVRVVDDEGGGDAFSLAAGIVAAVRGGAQIINISLGTQGDSFLVREAIAYARQAGAVIVASTGNDAVEGVLYPARYEDVVAVAAVDAARRHAYFSNRGPEVDLAAPGIALSTAATNGAIGFFGGTSAAAPMVSGALAVLLSREPGLTPDAALALLTRYADDAGDPGRDERYGHGIPNLKRVAERNTPGRYDIAAGDLVVHYPARESDDLTAFLSAQNRGTEPIYQVSMTVECEGIQNRLSFFNVQPGQTVAHQVRISRARLEQLGAVSINYRAQIEGQSDADPLNNGRRVTVSLPPAPQRPF